MKSQSFLVPEELLLRKLNRRDELAFQWLYDQYAHVLYGVILTSVGQPSIASRLVEDVFVKAWNDFDQFNPRKTRLLTWMLSRARAEISVSLAKTVPSSAKSTIDYEVIDNPITAEQRILLDAVYFRGQSITQLAEMSQQPERTLQARLRHVLQELKSLFSQ
ncbi:RNA polymerase sigma factor [Fibrella arboris]|uniref:RNA polymerase sigma factor n=1 Tax=Fibrella arboris TaxID=3242486 RepID=UPI0035211972